MKTAPGKLLNLMATKLVQPLFEADIYLYIAFRVIFVRYARHKMPDTSNNARQYPDGDNTSASVPIGLFLLLVATFLYMFLFDLPATPFFGDADQSIFLYEAERMYNGDVMYRDFFQFTLPGTQAFYTLMFAIFGIKFWIVGATTLIIGVVTTLLMLTISKRILPSPLFFLPAAIYIFFGFRWAGFDGSHRMFSPVFILIAIWLVMNGRGMRNLVLAGCSLAVASFFTQQRGFVVLASILCFLLIEKFFYREMWPVFIKSASAVALSFVICLSGLCIYFVVAAGAENFFYATVTYPLKYYSSGHPNHFGVYFAELQQAFTISKASDILALAPVILYCLMLPLTILSMLLIFVMKRKTVDWDVWRGPVLIALTGFFLTFSITAPNMIRLFQISGPTLIVLVWLFHRFGPAFVIKRRLAYTAVAGLMMLGAFQAIRAQINWEVVYLNSPVGRLALVASKQAERYIWLSKNTTPGEYFFEVYEPFVYFPLGLKNPTRFGQIWPSEYTRPEQVAEAVLDLDEKRPRYILWDNGYLSSAIPRVPGDHTGPLADFVQMRYSPIGEIYEINGKSIQFWELKAK